MRAYVQWQGGDKITATEDQQPEITVASILHIHLHLFLMDPMKTNSKLFPEV